MLDLILLKYLRIAVLPAKILYLLLWSGPNLLL